MRPSNGWTLSVETEHCLDLQAPFRPQGDKINSFHGLLPAHVRVFSPGQSLRNVHVPLFSRRLHLSCSDVLLPAGLSPDPGLYYPALQAECVLDFYSCPVNERSTLTLRFTWRRWKNTEAKTQITCQPTPKIKKPHYSDSVCHLLPSLRYIIGFTLSRQRHILSCR